LLATGSGAVDAGLAAAGVASAPSNGPTTTAASSAGARPLSGPDLAYATATAERAAPGTTVLAAERDPAGAYDVHMTKAEGTFVTVTLDAGLQVTGVSDAFAGDPPDLRPGGMGPPGSVS